VIDLGPEGGRRRRPVPRGRTPGGRSPRVPGSTPAASSPEALAGAARDRRGRARARLPGPADRRRRPVVGAREHNLRDLSVELRATA
jgi:hypothetical protein